MQVQSLGQEDPLVEGMSTHSCILAWRMPSTEEPGRVHRVAELDLAHMHTLPISQRYSSQQYNFIKIYKCITVTNSYIKIICGRTNQLQKALQKYFLKKSRKQKHRLIYTQLTKMIKMISSVQSLGCVRFFATHGLQHVRLPCPSPTFRACSNSCPSSW